jgi:hypothetical protein
MFGLCLQLKRLDESFLKYLLIKPLVAGIGLADLMVDMVVYTGEGKGTKLTVFFICGNLSLFQSGKTKLLKKLTIFVIIGRALIQTTCNLYPIESIYSEGLAP